MTCTACEIAIIDDEAVIRDTLGDFLTRKGHRIRPFADSAIAQTEFRNNPPDIVLLDIRMAGEDGLAVLANLRAAHPELPVIMISGHGTMDTAIESLRQGAADFLRKPIHLPDLIAALERTHRLMRAERDRDRLRANLARVQAHANPTPEGGFIADSAACREICDFLEAASRTPFDNVLLIGETGTGKDVLARELHRRLHGLDAPFVVVNCPALPDSLVESELFGHTRGSFTGAEADQPGAFELADGGTLFLDELADLAKGAQAKLLRALEARRIRRLGGHKDIPIAVTVIAATNQDLSVMVEGGGFRRDLFYRLNTFQLAVPPLREHRDDIPALASHFLLQTASRRHQATASFTPEALAALVAYDYPGNVRELRNLIERAVLLSRNGVIDLRDLALPNAQKRFPTPLPVSCHCEDPEAQATQAALIQHKWNRRSAARALGISYEALRWRIDKFRLDR